MSIIILIIWGSFVLGCFSAINTLFGLHEE